MKNEGMKFAFSAKPYHYSVTEGVAGWVFVSLPKEISIDIRNIFKCLEEGWGRLKVTAIIGNTQWQTAIWFDTKQDTYLLPLKVAVRKKECIELNKPLQVIVCV